MAKAITDLIWTLGVIERTLNSPRTDKEKLTEIGNFMDEIKKELCIPESNTLEEQKG